MEGVEHHPLRGIRRIVRLVGAGEMAHHEAQVEAVEPARVEAGGGLVRGEAEPGHAAVDLQDRRQASSEPGREGTPGGSLPVVVQDRREIVRMALRLGAGRKAVQNRDPGGRSEYLAQREALLGMGHEEGAAARPRQGGGDAFDPQTVGIRLDDGGARRPRSHGLQGAVVGGERREVDRQDGAGRRRYGRSSGCDGSGAGKGRQGVRPERVIGTATLLHDSSNFSSIRRIRYTI
ncbi:hypothetical protein M2440_000024 [Methylorubrum extorquens]|nr:hypothetical protein [Methylorubrum extorquens]